MKKKEYIEWIDIAKGILIILVVLGHSIPGPHYELDKYKLNYIYLFHMPAFFIISGYLYKPIEKINLKGYIIKKTKRLLLPYLTYLSLINGVTLVFNIFTKKPPITMIIKEICKSIFGGQYLGYNAGVLWFITCLLFTEILFVLIDTYIISRNKKIIIISILYFIAHLQAWYLKSIAAPLALDICLIAIMYYSIGAYFKNKILDRKNLMLSILIVILVIFIKESKINIYPISQYGLELIGHNNYYLILDLIIPCSFAIVIFNVCKAISRFNISKVLSELGKYTLPIMCLHIIINEGISIYIHSVNIYIYTIVGIVIPYILAKFIISRNTILKKMFM